MTRPLVIEGSISSLVDLCNQARLKHPYFRIETAPEGGVQLRFHGEWVWPDAAEAVVEKQQVEAGHHPLRQLWKWMTGRHA